MSLLLKLWAAVAVAFAGANHEVSPVKAQSIENTISCVRDTEHCYQGYDIYHNQLNGVSRAILSGLGLSYVQIAKEWEKIKVPQEKSEL